MPKTNSDKILTISIAAYNSESYIDNCLSSLLECKSREQLEIIIVNDGSTDSTEAICRDYSRRYSGFITLINKENGGHGSTINTSIVNATGKYYKILDSDDWVESENLDRLVDHLSATDADLVINPFFEVCAQTKCKQLSNVYTGKKLNPHKDYSFEEMNKNLVLAMHGMTFRTELIKEMGPVIDEKCFYVDAEYIIFPLPKVKTINVLDYPVYDYLLGTATQSMNLNNMIKRRDQHRKVTERMATFYDSLEESYIKENVIKDRIHSLIFWQYILYLKAENTDTKDEFYDFDSTLKNLSYEIYKTFPKMKLDRGKPYLKIIPFLREHPDTYGIIKSLLR